MTATITYALGKFVWHELYSPDPAASQRFYGDVFGWAWKDMPMGDFTYRIASLGDKQIGGMMGIKEMAPPACDQIPPHWGTYVSVDDVDAGAERVKAAGGQVLMGPENIPGIGRFATIQDPQGGVTNLYRSADGDGADAQPGVGEFSWESLMTTDTVAATTFYQAVVGWGTTPMGDGATTLFTREGGAKQVANISPASPGLPTHWLCYITVANREETNAKITAAGGTLVEPAIDIPGVGGIALVQDPQGAMFCTFQPAME